MFTKNLLPAIALASGAITVAAGPANAVHRHAFKGIPAHEDVPVNSPETPAPPAYTPRPVLPRDGMCWNSILDSQWSVSQLEFQSSVVSVPDEEDNAWGYVSFDLSNTATTYTADCTAASNTNADVGFFNGEQEYLCSLSDGAPLGSQVAFRFNKARGALWIQEIILCGEGDISGTFITRGTTEVSLACSEETSENETFTNHEVKCGPVNTSLWPFQVIGLEEY